MRGEKIPSFRLNLFLSFSFFRLNPCLPSPTPPYLSVFPGTCTRVFTLRVGCSAHTLYRLDTAMSRDWGNRLGRAQTKPCVHQEKGAAAPQETEPALPVSVQESPVEVWVHSTCRGARDTDRGSPGSCSVLA